MKNDILKILLVTVTLSVSALGILVVIIYRTMAI